MGKTSRHLIRGCTQEVSGIGPSGFLEHRETEPTYPPQRAHQKQEETRRRSTLGESPALSELRVLQTPSSSEKGAGRAHTGAHSLTDLEKQTSEF